MAMTIAPLCNLITFSPCTQHVWSLAKTKLKSSQTASFHRLPIGLIVPKWRRIDVDATSSRRIDVNTTSFLRHVPAG